MIAMESGTAFAYAIDKLQDRGKFFIFPQEEVYAGQVVGEHSHDNDLVINVTKSKKLTNMRASGSDDKARTGIRPYSSLLRRHWSTSRRMNMWKLLLNQCVCVRLSSMSLSVNAQTRTDKQKSFSCYI